MNEKDRLMFYALKWIIERDNFHPDTRRKMDEDICSKIVNFVNPKESNTEQKIRDSRLEETRKTIKFDPSTNPLATKEDGIYQ